jgi:hypothetical protein
MRCKGCGINIIDDPRMLSVHLQARERCVAEYEDHTIWVNGYEVVWGTLHVSEVPAESKRGKWKIYGLLRGGMEKMVHREKAKTKALAWIEEINERRK